eukprot:scaffold76357_cov29-Tisochrysis_lutea.AAC.1
MLLWSELLISRSKGSSNAHEIFPSQERITTRLAAQDNVAAVWRATCFGGYARRRLIPSAKCHRAMGPDAGPISHQSTATISFHNPDAAWVQLPRSSHIQN